MKSSRIVFVLKTLLVVMFVFVCVETVSGVFAQSDISGTVGAYSFSAGSYENVSRADDALSPLEPISWGNKPSSTLTYQAEENGYVSFMFEPSAGGDFIWLNLNGELYGNWWSQDNIYLKLKEDDTVTFTVSPCIKQVDYEMISDEDTYEMTITETYAWNTTTGQIKYNLTPAEFPDIEFYWTPSQPESGDKVLIYLHNNMGSLDSITWTINDQIVDTAQDQAQWELQNIQDGVYEVTLRVEDSLGVTSEKTKTLIVGQENVFYGIVFDDLGNKYSDLTIHLYWDDVYQGTTWTDEDGYYEFKEINGQPIVLPLNGMGEVKIEFMDKDHVFELRDLDADQSKPVSVTYPVTDISSTEELEYNIGFYKDMADDTDTPMVNEALTDEHALIYHYTNIAKKFFETKLNYYYLNKPLIVATENKKSNDAWFSSAGNPMIDGSTAYPMIYLSTPTMPRTSNEAPINREFHEFSHYVMWDYYGGFPPSHYYVNGTGHIKFIDLNHNGFRNHCSSDSYVEGFAEFMALVINKEMNVQPPSVSMLPDFMWSRYPIGNGNEYLEYNKEQWSVEELSFASVLWDLYDEVEETDNDTITLGLTDLWNILCEPYSRPVYYRFNQTTGIPDKLDESTTELRHIHYIIDLYEGLLENEPYYSYSTSEVDAVFTSHDIYNDTNGDGAWQQGEPIGVNLLNYKDRRKHPVDESKQLTLDIPESMLPMDIMVSTVHGKDFSEYDHSYTITVYDYPVKIPVMMPPMKYSPTMKIEALVEGVTDSNPLVLDHESYWSRIISEGNLGTHTPGVESELGNYIVISELNTPDSVETGSTLDITASLDYSFSDDTLISVGVYDYSSESLIFEEETWVQGSNILDYLIQLTAPDSEQTLELEVNVVYQIEEEWYYTEGDKWYSYFTVDVVKPDNNEIPGYSMVSILTALTITLYISQKENH